MASLESLRNPLSRLAVLGTEGSQSTSWRRNEVTNASDWDVSKQYYLNDMVFSGVDGGAYVMTGGPVVSGSPVTAVLGGEDPAIAWASEGSLWEPAAAYGPRLLVPAAPGQQTATAAANAITFTNCTADQALVGANVSFGVTNYFAHVQCTIALPLVATPADFSAITFTPNGTAPVARSLSIQPMTGSTNPNNWSGQLYLEVPSDATQIVVSGAYEGQIPTISNLRVVYTPVVI